MSAQSDNPAGSPGRMDIPPRRNVKRTGPQSRANAVAVHPPNEAWKGIFWVVTAVFLVLAGYTAITRPFTFTAAGSLVALLALLPAYLWYHGRVEALPIFPFYAGTFLLTHALQFSIADPALRAHPTDAVWRASLTVSGFLLIGTLAWHYWSRKPRPLPESCLMLEAQRGTNFLTSILVLATLVTVVAHAGWLSGLYGGVMSLVIGFFRGPTSFAAFVLALRWGGGSLRRTEIFWFLFWFIAFCVADASSLYLVTVIGVCVMLGLGVALGKKAVPWGVLSSTFCIVALLHVGKGEMRSRYWAENEQERAIKPWGYPAFFGEWFRTSLENLALQKVGLEEEHQSVFSRVGTINLLFQAQEMAPDEVPFLKGETYAIIPSALVPRVFNPEKASPHESTTLLNVHFGNQTREEAQRTSIGWGLLNEAYANFGYLGCALLAIVLGTFYGLMTRWSAGLPPSSLPVLVGIFTLGFTLQTEMTASVFITSYLQGLFALLVMARLVSERRLLKTPAPREPEPEPDLRRRPPRPRTTGPRRTEPTRPDFSVSD